MRHTHSDTTARLPPPKTACQQQLIIYFRMFWIHSEYLLESLYEVEVNLLKVNEHSYNHKEEAKTNPTNRLNERKKVVKIKHG